MDTEKKYIDELLALYELEKVKDVYVEGDIDKNVVEWFLHCNGRHDITVYSIDTVNISNEELDSYDLPYPSNRSKVILLSKKLAQEKKIQSTVLCIADRDYEDFIPSSKPNQYCPINHQ